jgi:predicted transcriptional regulator of viral defense system
MKKDSLSKFNKSIFITKEALRTISNDKEETITKNIYRWVKSGDLIRLKNGLYISKEVLDRHNNKDNFKCLIANKLRSPSYVSLEYVLSNYNILTEAIYPITSVTLKTSRNYENKCGVYTYKSIKNSLFLGYKVENFLSNSYYIATKEKALFDYLYFKKDTLPKNLNNINLVKELRLNLDSFSKAELKSLRKFAEISKDKKVNKIIKNIIKNAHDNI